VNTVFNYLKEKNIKVKEDYEIKGFGEDFEQSKVQSENRKVLIVYEPITNEIRTTHNRQPRTVNPNKKAKSGDKIRLKNIYFL
jgi:hypothetical protein